tara:strand:+ start:1143 stop:1496 length:354 start_codon:yes stop_codon:yes gene_type:complete
MGRPPWIPTDEICEEARDMASRGLTISQISDCLGVSERTIYDKQIEYPHFMQCIKEGRSEGINQVTNALFEKAIKGDNTCMIFYLKSRDRESWGDQYIEPIKEIPPIQITIDSSAIK